MGKLKFEETQKFRQKWTYFIYLLIVGILGIFIYADIQQIILGHTFGNRPAPDIFLIIATLLLLTMLVLFYQIKFETKINDEGVFFRWVPFKKTYSQFNWSSVGKAEIFKYGFVGFSWRLTPYGTVYTTGGNTGLRLILKSGRKIILGTQKPKEVEIFLRQLNVLN